MSQNEIRINNKVVVIPKDSFEQDEFIGLWRQAQEKAINVLKYDIEFIKDLDLEVDKKTYNIYLDLKRRTYDNR